MLKTGKINELNDYFKDLNERREQCFYFIKLNRHNKKTDEFLRKYYDSAGKCGIICEGKIPNPEPTNLSYYDEIMGNSFRLDKLFFKTAFRKWLPEISELQADNFAESMIFLFSKLQKMGKNENIIKNIYIKFMCFLYYKFRRIGSQIAKKDMPKIMHFGEIGKYDGLFFLMLAYSGCDIILLNCIQGNEYLNGGECLEYPETGESFPNDYGIKSFKDGMMLSATCIADIEINTNKWAEKLSVETIFTPRKKRSDGEMTCNCFIRINGAEDALVYENELRTLHSRLIAEKRSVLILEGDLPVPSNEEISGIKRKNYSTPEEALKDLSLNINLGTKKETEKIARNKFISLMLEIYKAESLNVNRLVSMSVVLLCKLKRYQNEIFGGGTNDTLGCCLCLNTGRNKADALFIRLLGGLPADVLIFIPNLNDSCIVKDDNLFEITYNESLSVCRYPKAGTNIGVGTAAYRAERELDSLLYDNTGIYRDMQHTRAEALFLKTTYEEISIIWNEELKFRPNFSADGGNVIMPVVFAKVSGVKNKDTKKYWQDIKLLMTEDAVFVGEGSLTSRDRENPIKPFAVSFYKRGKLLKNDIKKHSAYQYAFLREEMQDHILDKLSMLVEQKIIKGTFENGTEYTIISEILNLDKEILRKLQSFDFAKKNPKLVYIRTGEETLSTEETAVMVFLSLCGFDVLMFVPTGYNLMEGNLNKPFGDEHIIGPFMYDMRTPDMRTIKTNNSIGKIFHDLIMKGR